MDSTGPVSAKMKLDTGEVAPPPGGRPDDTPRSGHVDRVRDPKCRLAVHKAATLPAAGIGHAVGKPLQLALRAVAAGLPKLSGKAAEAPRLAAMGGKESSARQALAWPNDECSPLCFSALHRICGIPDVDLNYNCYIVASWPPDMSVAVQCNVGRDLWNFVSNPSSISFELFLRSQRFKRKASCDEGVCYQVYRWTHPPVRRTASSSKDLALSGLSRLPIFVIFVSCVSQVVLWCAFVGDAQDWRKISCSYTKTRYYVSWLSLNYLCGWFKRTMFLTGHWNVYSALEVMFLKHSYPRLHLGSVYVCSN